MNKEEWSKEISRLFLKGLESGIEPEYLLGAVECVKYTYLTLAVNKSQKLKMGWE